MTTKRKILNSILSLLGLLLALIVFGFILIEGLKVLALGYSIRNIETKVVDESTYKEITFSGPTEEQKKEVEEGKLACEKEFKKYPEYGLVEIAIVGDIIQCTGRSGGDGFIMIDIDLPTNK